MTSKIDQTGTAPGIQSIKPEIKTVAMKCRNAGCLSMKMEELGGSDSQKSSRVYRCVKCNYTMEVALGGALNL